MTTRKRKPIGYRNAEKFKKAGGSKEQYLETISTSIRKAGKDQGWRPSEIAMSIAERVRIADEVWGA